MLRCIGTLCRTYSKHLCVFCMYMCMHVFLHACMHVVCVYVCVCVQEPKRVEATSGMFTLHRGKATAMGFAIAIRLWQHME